MQSVFTALIERSLAMSALILLYIAVTPLLEKRYIVAHDVKTVF